MVSKIQKWGNSLALRIPKPFAQSIGLDFETEVNLAIEDDKLIITKSTPHSHSLDELLTQVTKENLHGEVDFGNQLGREAW
jgi:antitoxin MazE